MRHSDRARDQRTVMCAGMMAAARGVRAQHSDRARDQRTVVSAGTTAAARGVRVGVGMREMQRATFAAAALSNRLRASASSFRWSQTLAVLLCRSHCLSVRAICDRQCYAAGPDCPILAPLQALLGSDCLAGRRQLRDLCTAREMTSLRRRDGRDCLKVKSEGFWATASRCRTCSGGGGKCRSLAARTCSAVGLAMMPPCPPL